MSFSKNGIIHTSFPPTYKVNNFTETGVTTGWNSSGTLSNGILVLTGTSPSITSVSFSVSPDEIIVFEFTVSLPTPSTTTSGPGLYLGTLYGLLVYVHSFNTSTKKWSKSTTVNTNPYFLNSYNKTDVLTLKNYILGYNVDVTKMPFLGETTNTSYSPRAILMPEGTTSTNIRSGYNSNTSMVINFSNPKIYSVDLYGLNEKDINTVSIEKNGVISNNFIEI